MVRPKVPHVPGAFYHVTLRGNRRQNIFITRADHEMFERVVRDAIERHAVEVHAYCWMPNHVHLLARVGEMPLYRFVQHFASRYARRFNDTHDTVGHLFQGRYWAGLIDSDEYLLSTLRYIHQNPVAAGLSTSPNAYPWSSHVVYAGQAARPWVTTRFLIALFGSDDLTARKSLLAFVDNLVPRRDDRLESLIREAEWRFDVTVPELHGRSRHPHAVLARAWIAFYASRKLGMTLEEVGDHIGRSPRALADGITRYLARLTETEPEFCSGDILRLRGESRPRTALPSPRSR